MSCTQLQTSSFGVRALRFVIDQYLARNERVCGGTPYGYVFRAESGLATNSSSNMHLKMR